MSRFAVLMLPIVLLLLVSIGALPIAAAYTPGSGSVYSDDFEGELDPDWKQENGLFGTPSPWSQVLDSGDTSFNADGRGPLPSSSTRHWARHPVHPVPATTFSVAFEYRSELGAGYDFALDLIQRAPNLREYRLAIDGQGTLSLLRSEGTVLVNLASAAGAIPAGGRRWIRLAIEAGDGHRWLRCRVWSGSAEGEPATGWTLEAFDDLDVIERVHRLELTADGPQGVDTWIDDLELFGDTSVGVDSSVKTIYLVELSHLDIGFTEPVDDIETFAKTHLDQVLDNLEADPNYHWTIENGWWLDRWWERSTEAERERMTGHLQEGRLVLAAGYANLHSTKVSREELVRALYYSSTTARELGVRARTWYQDDVPGATFALPEVLARAGVDYYVGGMNTGFGGKLSEPDHGDRPFWWIAPDGSRVLAWITFDSYAEGLNWGFSFFDNLPDLYKKMGEKLPEQEEAGYPWPEMMLLRGFDNHYQGFKTRDLAEEWNATYDNPKFVLSTAEAFLDRMLDTHGPDAFPSYSGDFGAAWSGSNAGTQHIQEWIRQAHRDVAAGEMLVGSARAIDGGSAESTLRRHAYRKMLESDEHSGAGGWPGYFTPEEFDRNARQHFAFAREARDDGVALVDRGLRRLVADLPASGDAVVAVNTLGFETDGWVRQALPAAIYDTDFRVVERGSGRELVYQRFDAQREILFRAQAVPAAGYRVYDLLPGTPTAQPQGVLSVDLGSLENDFYRVDISGSDGSVTSFYDKTRGLEMIDPASAYRFNEVAHNTHQDTTAGNKPIAQAPSAVTVSIAESGPLRVSLRVQREGTPHVESFYRLYRGEDRFEIENVLDRDAMAYVPNDQHSWKYMVTWPFDIHDFSIRSETAVRFLDPLSDGFARENLFDWHNVEHTLAFWDATRGLLTASDSVSAFHFENLSGLTSPAFSTTDALLLPRMKDKADEYEFEDGTIGPVEQEPDTSPLYTYVHHFRSTDPGFDPLVATAFGVSALTPLRSAWISRQPGNMPRDESSIFEIDAPGVLLATIKPAEDGRGSVLRLVELSGAAAVVGITSRLLTIVGAERLEADEEGGTPLGVTGGRVEVALEPYEMATVRIESRTSWSPIELSVTKDVAAGTVLLRWSGGVSPYTLERSISAQFTDAQRLVDEEDVQAYDDSVLDDGVVYFYLAR